VSDVRAHEIDTITILGVLIVNATRTMRKELESWSATLYNGGKDKAGNTIM
jgi:hypothetical protein